MLSLFIAALTVSTFVCLSDAYPYVPYVTKINGCSMEDILLFQSLINENIDTVNINQNTRSVSQEMIDFYETNFAETLTFNLTILDAPGQGFFYESRDAFLYLDIQMVMVMLYHFDLLVIHIHLLVY